MTFTHQHDAMDCGPACLQMIAKHYGRNYRLESLRDNCFLTREGVSLLGISEAAEKTGFRTTGVFDKVIQAILNNPDDVFLDDSKAQNSLVFVKQYKNIGTVIVGVNKADNRTLVFHKSFFNQRKNSYAKYKSVRVVLSLVGGHSTISHSGNPESASALSGRNDNAKVKNNFEPAKKISPFKNEYNPQNS
jgi:hypothetical protein